MVFVDTSGFIAAFNARDAHHRAAARAWRDLATTGEALVTTNLIFAETVTFVRRRGGFDPARCIGDAIRRSRAIEMVYASREHTASAWTEFLGHGWPGLSLCDALSFVVMRERGIDRVLGFDSDFSAAGFTLIAARGA
jgi:uncharacterized protein